MKVLVAFLALCVAVSTATFGGYGIGLGGGLFNRRFGGGLFNGGFGGGFGGFNRFGGRFSSGFIGGKGSSFGGFGIYGK